MLFSAIIPGVELLLLKITIQLTSELIRKTLIHPKVMLLATNFLKVNLQSTL